MAPKGSVRSERTPNYRRVTSDLLDVVAELNRRPRENGWAGNGASQTDELAARFKAGAMREGASMKAEAGDATDAADDPAPMAGDATDAADEPAPMAGGDEKEEASSPVPMADENASEWLETAMHDVAKYLCDGEQRSFDEVLGAQARHALLAVYFAPMHSIGEAVKFAREGGGVPVVLCPEEADTSESPAALTDATTEFPIHVVVSEKTDDRAAARIRAAFERRIGGAVDAPALAIMLVDTEHFRVDVLVEDALQVEPGRVPNLRQIALNAALQSATYVQGMSDVPVPLGMITEVYAARDEEKDAAMEDARRQFEKCYAEGADEKTTNAAVREATNAAANADPQKVGLRPIVLYFAPVLPGGDYYDYITSQPVTTKLTQWYKGVADDVDVEIVHVNTDASFRGGLVDYARTLPWPAVDFFRDDADGHDFIRRIRGVYDALGGTPSVPSIALLEPDPDTSMYRLSDREFVTVDGEGRLDGSALSALEDAAAAAREAHAQRAKMDGVRLCEVPLRKKWVV
jgi:hypothetical protein